MGGWRWPTIRPLSVARGRRQLPGRAGDDVDDRALATVTRRVLGNYLAGDTDNLRADLAPGARLTPPAEHLDLDDVVSLQWAGRARDRVSAVVVARDPSADVAYTLRYELRVAKRDRWYVAEINPPMARKELSVNPLPLPAASRRIVAVGVCCWRRTWSSLSARTRRRPPTSRTPARTSPTR